VSYWANPYDSKAGNEVLMDLFDGLFLDNGRTGFDSRDHARHFAQEFFQGRGGGTMKGVTAMRCLTLVYDDIPEFLSRDTGIYCCPTCERVDHIWNWEFVDMGFYSAFGNDNRWINGDFNPGKIAGGLYNGNGYGIIAQVRCNEVSHCTHCGISHQAPDSDIENCRICGRGPAKDQDDGLGMVQAGCGAMSTVYHEVPPITEAQSYTCNSTAISQRANLVTLVTSKSLTVRIPRTVRPDTLRLEWAGDSGVNRQGAIYRNKRDAMVWVPQLTLTLERTTAGRGSASDPLRFPITLFGGYSNRDSPLYPGMTAFGGAHIIRFSHYGVGTPDFRLTGYRTNNPGSGNSWSWNSPTRIPGYPNTVKSQGRIAITSRDGDSSRQNRGYHLEIASVPSGTIYESDPPNPGYRGISSNHIKVLNYAGSSRNQGWGNSVKDLTDALPIMRFRTEVPNYRGMLVDGRCANCGERGHGAVECQQQKRPVVRVNLLNPSIRDIDDWGMIRPIVAYRDAGGKERSRWPGTLWPIPKIPSILRSKNPPLLGVGLTCPNDVVAAYMIQCYQIDSAERVLAEIRRFLEAYDPSNPAATGGHPDYPWGVSPIGTITDPDIKDVCDQVGLTTPNDPPGSFYSYIIALSKARAIANDRPAFSSRRNLPVPYAGALDLGIDPGSIRNLNESWFYALHGGSGSRRTGDLVPPTRYRRFGTVQSGREMVEDFSHPSGIEPLQPNVVKTHNVQKLPDGYVIEPDKMKVYNTQYCTTCRGTHFPQGRQETRGSILVQFQNDGVVTDLALATNGAPETWNHNPRNSRGMAPWMVAAHVAWEDNRKFVICADSEVVVDPAGTVINRNYLVPLAEADGGIADNRFAEPRGFVNAVDLPSIPGYSSHDDDSVTISGVEYPVGIPRESYLLSPPGDYSDYSPFKISNSGPLQVIANNNGPFYRRLDTPEGTFMLPVMWGILRDGHEYTAGASSLTTGGVP
jgi:hypothetical protein